MFHVCHFSARTFFTFYDLLSFFIASGRRHLSVLNFIRFKRFTVISRFFPSLLRAQRLSTIIPSSSQKVWKNVGFVWNETTSANTWLNALVVLDGSGSKTMAPSHQNTLPKIHLYWGWKHLTLEKHVLKKHNPEACHLGVSTHANSPDAMLKWFNLR